VEDDDTIGVPLDEGLELEGFHFMESADRRTSSSSGSARSGTWRLAWQRTVG
jgi:hypothetical protein